ncbi:MAG: HAMP domain-containing sensor histidine kinase [Campylobacterota bacterium]|nr:HAMP domain-containing sensor histidine kinase [Campylobacterota bacterium]
MFRNQRIYIFIFYFLTVTTFSITINYILNEIKIENIYILSIIFLCLTILAGVFISKLAVDPLERYVINIKNLSNETLHELNLPITTIKTNLQMLQKNINDEKNIKRLNRIKNASNMLQLRYNELDYMIKTQTKIKIEELFSLDELIKQRIDFLQNIYPHITFNLNLEPTQILNDKIGLSKIIDNIIDNGVKYSDKSNTIEIELNQNELKIKDYGCGIDEVEIIHIFDNYYQNDASIKGFGIGLGMIKRFCDTNNISLNIVSKINIGTTIILKFKKED